MKSSASSSEVDADKGYGFMTTEKSTPSLGYMNIYFVKNSDISLLKLLQAYWQMKS